MRLNWRGSVRSQSGRLAGPLARLAAAARVFEPVGTEAELARAAVDDRVGEAGDVAGRLPDARVEDDRGVEGDDVVALLHHRAEPERADVVLRQDAVVAVVVRRAEAAVDLGRREDEAAPAAEGDDRVHGQRWRGVGHAGGYRRGLRGLPARSCDLAAQASAYRGIPVGGWGFGMVTKGRLPDTLPADAEPAGRAPRRLRRHRRDGGAARAGARGAVPGAGLRRDPPPAGRVGGRPPARGQPDARTACGRRLHARPAASSARPCARSAAARASTTATCSASRSTPSRASRARRRR